jgi:DNA polymerase
MTPLSEFFECWKNGCGADECSTATTKPFCRGKVPCDILFTGEAAGQSEDSVGQPFVGPAGRLLDSIVAEAVPPHIRCAFTNIVVCLPTDADDGGKLAQPTCEQVHACAPRLIHFVKVAKPKLIVCVGKFAEQWLDRKYKGAIQIPLLDELGHGSGNIPQITIDHPAFILRANYVQQSLLKQKCVIRISGAIEDYLSG